MDNEVEEQSVTEQDQTAYYDLLDTLASFRTSKPDDRSEKDRHYAIAITELQKLIGFVSFWIMKRGG